jgi:hypothetical protein
MRDPALQRLMRGALRAESRAHAGCCADLVSAKGRPSSSTAACLSTASSQTIMPPDTEGFDPSRKSSRSEESSGAS